MSNYWPISLLSLISQVLERCVHNQVMDFLLVSNNHLSNRQFGFTTKSSTQDALLTVSKDWYHPLTTHSQIVAVFFDIKEAFDSVPHESPEDIGITGPLLEWFTNYLTNR